LVNKEIIEKCLRQEQQAYGLFYKACAPYVYTVIKSYIYDENYRRDAMQEVFGQIFYSLSRYDENKGSLKSWIAQVTINQCLTILRKRKKLSFIVAVDEVPEKVDVMISELDQLRRSELENLLQKMPTGYRSVFLLSILDGYSHKEIASLIGTSTENSRSQLSRAIRWVRKNLSHELKTILHE